VANFGERGEKSLIGFGSISNGIPGGNYDKFQAGVQRKPGPSQDYYMITGRVALDHNWRRCPYNRVLWK
jgi:hypothetical protein